MTAHTSGYVRFKQRDKNPEMNRNIRKPTSLSLLMNKRLIFLPKQLFCHYLKTADVSVLT
jgi:hypothetical protein